MASFHVVEQGIETLEILLPELAIPLQPNVELLQWRRTQGIDAALRVDASIDQSGMTEYPQMF
jgi:hypothetical protein